MVFKNVDDNDISYVETFIREKALSQYSQELDESFGEQSEALLDLNHMTNVFGRTYAKNPNEFQFHAGDLKLIKTLVEHVRTEADENGTNKGLHKFRSKKKKTTHTIVSNKMLKENIATEQLENQMYLDTPELQERRASLKKDLLRKTVKFLDSFGVDGHIAAILDESLVEVHFDGNQIYGTVPCVICKYENAKKQQPKRVYYHQSPTSSYWVLANLGNHLKGPHKLTAVNEPQPKTKRNTKRKNDAIKNALKPQNCSAAIVSEHIIEDDSEPTEKVVVISENETYEEVHVKVEPNHEDSLQIISAQLPPKADIQVDLLYKHLSDQIAVMIGKVLTNSDEQKSMTFVLDGQKRSIKVAPINKDGNCLFAAICHQISPTALDTAQHTNETANLRKNVVDYILKPENYTSFERELKNRVLDEWEGEDKIENFTMECKLFTRFKLSRSGVWGGYESVKAIGEIFHINIIVIKEDGDCYIANRSTEMYERSILLAYRKTKDRNKTVYYHYDSICDINSEALYEVAKFIAK